MRAAAFVRPVRVHTPSAGGEPPKGCVLVAALVIFLFFAVLAWPVLPHLILTFIVLWAIGRIFS